MGAETVVDKVRAIAERIAGGYGLEIFDVQFRREAPGMVLRVQIDRPATPVERCDLHVVERHFILAPLSPCGRGAGGEGHCVHLRCAPQSPGHMTVPSSATPRRSARHRSRVRLVAAKKETRSNERVSSCLVRGCGRY